MRAPIAVLVALLVVLLACGRRAERAGPSDDGFERLGRPRPGDWLAAHPEPGQTYEQYVRSAPNRPTAARRTIYLVALDDGSQASALMPRLADYAGRFFGLPARVLPPLAIADLAVTERTNRGDRQLLTGDLLARLRERLPGDAYCLIAFTDVDLYPEDGWNYVFGMATLRDRVGVFSLARYAPDLEPRSLKIMAHEVGHMFGLSHCVHYRCVMNGSNNLDEADRAPHHLCPVCLRKLQWAVGFDLAARYRALADFYRAAAMPDEAAFVTARAAAR